MRRKREVPPKREPRQRESRQREPQQRESRPGGRRQAQPATERFDWLDNCLLAIVAGLIVVTPLVPSEATVHEGSAAMLNLLWLLALFAWAAVLVLRPDPQVKFGWTGVAVAALVLWHTLSGLTAGMAGNGRHALNMLWQMVAYAVAAFLLRQLVHTPTQCRALIAAMVALAVLESVPGYYEYFVSKPAAVAKFQKNPEHAYQENGAVTDSQRLHLRWRIESKEPTVTFALANSLAGLLAAWLVALLGIGLAALDARLSRRVLVGVPALAAVIGGCLLLTKSRTAVLAAVVGAVVVVLYGRRGGWRIGWKIPLTVALVAVVIGLGAVAVGGLDAQVLSQAPTSVLFRLQYWQATAAIIAEQPLVGCGPGQFQAAYTKYKLPQASETPGDPHNFLLEIWATAGTPALLAVLAMALAFAWQLAGARSMPEVREDEVSSRFFVYAGALAGVLLAYPLGLVAGYPPELITLAGGLKVLAIWLLGLPAAAICIWLLDPWVVRGTLPVALPVSALVVLVVNLLAAGAVSFPGVMITAWLLVPLALVLAESPAWVWSPTRPVALGLLAAALGLAVLCMRTEVSPVLTAPNRIAVAEALIQAGRVEPARKELLAAASDDPWSPEPHHMLAQLELQVWTMSKQPEDWQRFAAAAEAYRKRDPQHHSEHADRGRWLLFAWRQSGETLHLEEAIAAYRQAVLCYPAQALARAQLAWALHLAGRDPEAAISADEALRLDSFMPHRELKLASQTVYDPQPGLDQAPPGGRNAEQVARQLRSSTSPETSP